MEQQVKTDDPTNPIVYDDENDDWADSDATHVSDNSDFLPGWEQT